MDMGARVEQLMREGHAPHSARAIAEAEIAGRQQAARQQAAQQVAAMVAIRYEVFMEQRKLLSRCTRRCGMTEYRFVPPAPY